MFHHSLIQCNIIACKTILFSKLNNAFKLPYIYNIMKCFAENILLGCILKRLLSGSGHGSV